MRDRVSSSRLEDTSTVFSFGENWEQFVRRHFSEERVAISVGHLLSFLRLPDLAGRSFLDVGCGSGLHSLAALRAGAARVVSFDTDPASVAATRRFVPLALRHRHNPLVQLARRAFPFSDQGLGVENDILDTFDGYSPRYHWTHEPDEVRSWFVEADLVNVRTLPWDTAVRGQKRSSARTPWEAGPSPTPRPF